MDLVSWGELLWKFYNSQGTTMHLYATSIKVKFWVPIVKIRPGRKLEDASTNGSEAPNMVKTAYLSEYICWWNKSSDQRTTIYWATWKVLIHVWHVAVLVKCLQFIFKLAMHMFGFHWIRFTCGNWPNGKKSRSLQF